ncbi:hypothetical protein [Nitrosospira sp. NRS527]|uniref:hypothetical protein n=1 Tax=Nitrosospira sp. NRS527 TaxID=155925 RepID=UPI001AFAFE6B|nr:hypothetical protein [Nitrosospira sp. NRS527]BCT67895.1 hypothetical protein NNRS527_01483 [Nitrosospira sp. NRS527]
MRQQEKMRARITTNRLFPILIRCLLLAVPRPVFIYWAVNYWQMANNFAENIKKMNGEIKPSGIAGCTGGIWFGNLE